MGVYSGFQPDSLNHRTARSHNITMLQTLQSGHGWVKQSAQGTQADDTTNYFMGSQSLKLTTDGAGSAIFTRKTGITAIDMTGKYLKFWARVDDPTKLAEFSLYISSDTFTNFAIYQIPVGQFQAGVWQPITVSYGEGTVTGSPTRSAIVSMQWRVKDDGTGAINCNLGGIASVAEPAAGVCSIVFDDSWSSQYDEARKKMDQYGMRGTIFTIPDLVGTAGYCTLAQLQAMYQNGWDISAHHQTNLTTLSASDCEATVVNVQKWLQRYGFHRGSAEIAYPNGGFNGTTIPIIQKYFRYGRTINQQAVAKSETVIPGDPYRARTYLVVNTTTTAAIATAITSAINNKHWIVLCFHKIVTSPTVSTEYSIANFGTVIDDLATQGIAVRTVADVLDDRI